MRNNKVINSLAVLLGMLSIFFFTQHDVSSSGIGLFIRKSIVCALAVYFCQKLIGDSFFAKINISELVVLLIWLGYVFFKFFFIAKSDIYENEIFIGVYSTVALILWRNFCLNIWGVKQLIYVINFIKVLLIIIPLVTVIHWLIYGNGIAYEEMEAVQQTSFREMREWISSYLGIIPFVAVFVLLSLFFYVFCLLNRVVYNCESIICKKSFRKGLAVFVAAIIASIYPLQTIAKSDWTGDYVKARQYANAIVKYGMYADMQTPVIEFKNANMISEKPHTIIMVIGESACRDKMKVYADDLSYDNTPWQSSVQNNQGFVFFNNGYSCHSMTMQVLENALTERSNYNKKNIMESMNIIDIAKKKGYKTYWITNLNEGNKATTFSMIADRADELYRIPDLYDDGMINLMENIDPSRNNFIVFHGNGSHSKYSSRYPSERTVYFENNVEDEYSNTIHYVDSFLKKVYDYGKNNLNLQVMIYYSDHGENLQLGHGPSDKRFEKVRIPMFVYLAPDYIKYNPEKYSNLLNNRETYFTNDMVYNTICGTILAESHFYDEKEDLSSNNYGFVLNDLLTFGGNAKVIDDQTLHDGSLN